MVGVERVTPFVLLNAVEETTESSEAVARGLFRYGPRVHIFLHYVAVLCDELEDRAAFWDLVELVLMCNPTKVPYD